MLGHRTRTVGLSDQLAHIQNQSCISEDTRMKICTKCGEGKPLDNFRNDKSKKTGKRERCSDCEKVVALEFRKKNRKKLACKSRSYTAANRNTVNAKARERYAKDPDKYSSLAKAYREKNPDLIITARKKYRSKNKCKLDLASKIYYENNIEKIKISQKEYQRKNRKRISNAAKQYRKANATSIKEWTTKHRKNNIEHYKKIGRNYYLKNKERCDRLKREWNAKNHERQKENKRIWRENNRGKVNEAVTRRHRVKIFATPPWAKRDEMQKIYQDAANMRKLGMDVHVDHIIPLQGKLVSGLHCTENLRIIYAALNLKKGNKFDVI